jgi:hypothetical protein
MTNAIAGGCLREVDLNTDRRGHAEDRTPACLGHHANLAVKGCAYGSCCATVPLMAPIGANPQTIRENIERAKQRRDAAQLELDEAVRELQWWRDGLAMFDPAGAVAEQAEELADTEIRRLVPDGFTRSPTMRQLILFAIRAEPAGEWPIARIFDVAAMHRWIDADDQEQLKRITDMTALMAREGLLVRADRGVYRLRDELIGALSRALHPITDYRSAARPGRH